MKTKLVEFLNYDKRLLRGVLTVPNEEVCGAVICLHGFERCSTTEKKFKILADKLANSGIATLRLDFSGCGLSDGDFKFTTIDKQGNDFVKGIDILTKEIKTKKVSIVAHSLGACVLANKIEKIKLQIEKIILIAPALNQKDLLRYWFTVSQMKKTSSGVEITWQNYKKYLDEDAFMEDCKRNDKVTKTSYINANYFMEAKDFDFSEKFDDLDLKILHIHGSKDIAVPLDSLNVKFENQIIVDGGDHDLEKPDKMNQWLQKSVNFIAD